jgi:cytochrome oxidase Cu insertion factor (SCO1/SenC/PrrC family)
MHRPSPRQRRTVILLLTLLTFGIAYYGGNKYSTPPPTNISGVLLSPAMPVPEFQLQQQAGEPFGNKQLQDHWSLLLLDPRSDQDASALQKLVQVHNRLAEDPLLQKHTVFIHAVKQSSEALIESIARLGSNFVLLSGEATAIDAFFEQLGNPQSAEDNPVLYLVDPDSNIQVLYTGDLDPAGIANDLHTLLANQR